MYAIRGFHILIQLFGSCVGGFSKQVSPINSDRIRTGGLRAAHCGWRRWPGTVPALHGSLPYYAVLYMQTPDFLVFYMQSVLIV